MIEWGRHLQTGRAHAWDRLENGRRRPACHFLEEAWTAPFPEDGRERCCACENAIDRRERSETGVRTALGVRWPHAVTLTRLASRAKVSMRAAESAADSLVERGLASYTETKAGRRSYYARRALVEESGRTYGMSY